MCLYYSLTLKIYFTSSTAEFYKYRDTYFSIRNFIVSSGHTLTRDWLPETEKALKFGRLDINKNIKQIYKECIKSIKEADLVIIEDTVSSFSTGHQITVAMQCRKPTLVLWQGSKFRQFTQMFIHGIESDMLDVVEYSPDKLTQILNTFINKYENANEKNRFHLVLNNVERNYLDWAQFTKDKSRTNIIREALRNAIESDAQYNKYLSEK